MTLPKIIYYSFSNARAVELAARHATMDYVTTMEDYIINKKTAVTFLYS